MATLVSDPLAVASVVARQEESLIALLDQCYGQPPWNESESDNMREAQLILERIFQPGVVTAILVGGTNRLEGIGLGWYAHIFLEDLRSVSNAGFSLKPPIFELHQLAVLPSAQGKGLGQALHDAVMREIGCPSLLLTHPEAEAALALYNRNGWTGVGHIGFGKRHPRVILLREAS